MQMANDSDIVYKLQNGEKVLCDNCNKGYYTTNAKDKKHCYYFECNNCGSHIHITPNIIVE